MRTCSLVVPVKLGLKLARYSYEYTVTRFIEKTEKKHVHIDINHCKNHCTQYKNHRTSIYLLSSITLRQFFIHFSFKFASFILRTEDRIHKHANTIITVQMLVMTVVIQST